MDRRSFVGSVATATLLGLMGCASEAGGPSGLAAPFNPNRLPDALANRPQPPAPVPSPEPPPVAKFQLPGGPIFGLPDEVGNKLAWTIDDGASPDVVRAYAKFAQETGTRLTFFMNGVYSSWADSAALFAPMVASGQVQIANHTFSHAGLTKLSDAQIQDELMRNHETIQSIFGVDARPGTGPPSAGVMRAPMLRRQPSGTRYRPCGMGRSEIPDSSHRR